MNRLWLIPIVLVAGWSGARAQTQSSPHSQQWFEVHGDAVIADAWTVPGEWDAVYYVAQRAVVFSEPDSARPYVEIQPREPIRVSRFSQIWAEVRTTDGALGYVNRSALSNLWLRISKHSKTVWIHRGADVVKAIPADMAYNFFLDKERRGSSFEPDHWRTPEGLYYVVAKNGQSRFYKALVLNYPSADDARKGFSAGTISEHEYYAILEADQRRQAPPMDTPLGGWIEIHGEGTGSRTTWTRGCVAVTNSAIDELWHWVPVGTPVLIEP